MKTKTRKVKPVDSDIHFKYICPNSECSDIHWLSLKEAQTSHFKIVCDCGEIFRPKRIENISINYAELKKIKPVEKRDLLNFEDAINTLVKFGFSLSESKKMIEEQYHKTGETNQAALVKFTLGQLGK